MKRGDVYWAELKPRSGSEQSGRRPVIIVSHNGFNQTKNWRSIIVIPLSTSQKQSKRGATAIHLSAREIGLPDDGIALCHQITTLDRSKLAKYIRNLSPKTLLKVESGIRAAVDLA